MITTTFPAAMASGNAYPIEPQAETPYLPEQLPIGSAVGAAINATSMGLSPLKIAAGLPP